ncbi:MAG: acyl-CoA dehydrogenase [Desulfobacteraceae bacterium 4572_19]|nr:MAG: acyl-CoA dehydrogenase [Desulfobacteraceae bacterium 4572_19]
MAEAVADRRDQEFVLHEMLNVAGLSEHEKFADFNKKTIDMVVKEARNLAVKEVLPTAGESDEQGCKLENGQVTAPECFKRPYKLFCEGEWIAMADDPKYGGQGMPKVLSIAAGEMFTGANCGFMMYPGLTHGAAKMIEEFGTQEQIDLFLEKMYTGQWGGTMCLTEPEAGSDVGALTSTAVKNDDGTYTITGNKIFISGGDHDLTENIIHPVLARIEGAPAGTKGISLFIVPKIWVNEDGTLGEDNDVVCTGIEEKMGIHGNSTCSLAFGGKGKCRGTLLGEANKGMKAMFLMMNEARLGVGMQGHGFASVSYVNAVSAKYNGLIELLTPIAKAYCTDKAFEVCVQGVQVYGGYGYIKEYPQEQLLRDCKITSIYEGTNGIQSMDFLGRKLGMNKGKPVMDLLGEMNATIAKAKETEGLEEMAKSVEAAVNKLGEVAMHMGMTAMSEKVMDAFASSVPFLEVTGDVIMAWLSLWRASIAAPLVATAKKKDVAFYDGQVKLVYQHLKQVLIYFHATI